MTSASRAPQGGRAHRIKVALNRHLLQQSVSFLEYPIDLMPTKKPGHVFLWNDQRWCQWCAQAVTFRRFDKHTKACEMIHQPKSLDIIPRKRKRSMHTSRTTTVDSQAEGFNTMIPERGEENGGRDSDYESEEGNSLCMGISGAGNEPDNMQSSPKSPESFIEIRYHPHSGNLNTTIIPLNNPQEKEPGSNTGCVLSSISAKPWAPFRTRADFEFAEEMVKSGLHSESIRKLLEGFNGRWATQTLISMKNFANFQDSLAAARHFSVQYHFTFKYRDPWRWLLDIVTDPTLSQLIIWYPEEKYLHQGSRITRIYGELNSGTRWWEIQDTLPHELGMPHVYLPLHLWLDKSSVAQTVTKHPIVLRPGFLPSTIRNGSGNGGGALIGYMVVVGDPNDDADNEDEKLDSVEYAQFKREMTQIEENQEAIARIRTAVDLHDEYLTRAIEEQNRTDGAKKYEKEHVGQPGFRFFERNLHDFLHHNIPLQERPSEPLQIVPYQCLYLRYRSLENWQEKQDILRCNAEFHGQPRYDCVLINTNPVTYGRIRALFSCFGPGKGDTETSEGKVNILLQGYISKAYIEDFALVSDMAYVAQTVAALFGACLKLL
ncbi:hypothetical protein M422DRAFT_266678 [Sphaerobolus stellatus SS14]|uniref:SEC63 domain-containing protein n=1 Tax=Sphaerobolus stellatus (strain SS14) TaxID=990650 RepID=A0A0C9TNP0_SPHS4|nr:hypothetical protein M422DRAFT_266678 [Sphaerobolus stellatus SS14]